MKVCVLCNTKNDDGAFECKKCKAGIWELEKDKIFCVSKESKLVEKMLRESTVPYTDEIRILRNKIVNLN
jgi:hypothetical protein